MKLILASNSPRRKELLKNLGFPFQIKASDYEEKSFSSDPILTATTFAKGKADDIFSRLENNSDCIVLGADTVVFLKDEILGKPKDEIHARKMLKKLSNKEHNVVTGFCIKTKDIEIVDFDVSLVKFNELTDNQIDEYIKSRLCFGKAGGYGIQDVGFNLIDKHNGSLNNIIGLPTEKIFPLLKKILDKQREKDEKGLQKTKHCSSRTRKGCNHDERK